jgi:hypothetical protein
LEWSVTMKKIEEAAQRLGKAVARLEMAALRVGGLAAEKNRLAEALAAAKAEYVTLEKTVAVVTSRLDGTIERISNVLDR